ncbi:hypothetical protein B4O97_09335 [Marispirochaeta aestuarii]|uniref:DUF1468 domain-containing protein n=1 Tax=Marispirochaeta aestuarii TaxID=1963862 RepID=A0A1Y1RY34_9SPIO|nr:tripartite tricarboxylate transporter TctB family protein [Marispirochaeta aestuarii]ORC35367.1 hypothetical protein B4O97_09335 [Marispirochaeta aestuarii]
MVQQKKDIWSGFFSLILGLAVLIASFGIDKTRLAGVGPEYLPKAVGIYISILSLILISNSLYELNIKKTKEKKDKDEGPLEVRTFVASVILLISYIFLLKVLGFIIMSAVFLFGEMYILAPRNHRNILLFLILSTGLPTAVYFLFVNVFNLLLPAGILG